jgi:putative addiction module antidote
MQTSLKITQIGNSLGVVLPKELLAKLRVGKGDTVFVSETPEGVTLTPFDPTFDEQVALGREFMNEFKDTFHALAK